MADAASPDPALSPALHAPGSDKADRGMVDSTSRGTAQWREQDQPPFDAHSAKKVAKSPNYTGAPRTGSRNHVENATSPGAIIINYPDVEDTSQTADTKPGFLAAEKIGRESKKVVRSKNALTFDNPSKKNDREKRPTKEQRGE